MVVIFPVAKLLVLLVSHISRPLAMRIKQRAVNHPNFRYFCIVPAQFYNNMNVRFRMYRLKMDTQGVEIAKLSENRAVELGSNILSEVIIIGTGTAATILELNRQKGKDEEKKKWKAYEIQNLHHNILDVTAKIRLNQEQLTQITEKMKDLKKRKKI